MAKHHLYRHGIGGGIRVERSDLQVTLRRCQCHHRYQLELVCLLWHQTGAIWEQERVGAAENQLACKSCRRHCSCCKSEVYEERTKCVTRSHPGPRFFAAPSTPGNPPKRDWNRISIPCMRNESPVTD